LNKLLRKRKYRYDYVYLMKAGGILSPWRKIGVADNVQSRRAAIQRSWKQKIKVKLAVQVILPYQFEKFLHSLFSVFNFPLQGRDGGTERFFLPFPFDLVVMLIMIVYKFLNISIIILCFALTLLFLSY
jgi:hypothetical protein